MAYRTPDRNDPDRHTLVPAPGLVTGLYAIGLANLFWTLVLLQANLGWPAVLALAVFLDYLITRLAHHRRRANADTAGDHHGG